MQGARMSNVSNAKPHLRPCLFLTLSFSPGSVFFGEDMLITVQRAAHLQEENTNAYVALEVTKARVYVILVIAQNTRMLRQWQGRILPVEERIGI